MKVQIDTIPIWEALEQDSECPLCLIAHKLEQDSLQSAMGGASIEPDIRLETNEKGFCAHHFGMLYAFRERLPLALMAHTHLQRLEEKLDKPLSALSQAGTGKRSPFAKAPEAAVAGLVSLLEGQESSCHICQRLDTLMERYCETMVHLYLKDAKFRTRLEQGRGFCLPHFKAMLLAAQRKAHGKGQQALVATLCGLQKKALERLDGELKHYTVMFDYRNTGGDWGTSRDALPRTLEKLRGGLYQS